MILNPGEKNISCIRKHSSILNSSIRNIYLLMDTDKSKNLI